jgi:hypothetical protein
VHLGANLNCTFMNVNLEVQVPVWGLVALNLWVQMRI